MTCRRTTASGNPVQLNFCPVIGRSTCDVTASAIGMMGSSGSSGIEGLGGVNMSGSAFIDSYNSNNGPYSAAVATVRLAAHQLGSLTGVNAATGRRFSLTKITDPASASQKLAAQGVSGTDIIVRVL